MKNGPALHNLPVDREQTHPLSVDEGTSSEGETYHVGLSGG